MYRREAEGGWTGRGTAVVVRCGVQGNEDGNSLVALCGSDPDFVLDVFGVQAFNDERALCDDWGQVLRVDPDWFRVFPYDGGGLALRHIS